MTFKILLVNPLHPSGFWTFDDGLKLVRKRAALPPLGLLTVAAMLPEGWPKRLVDLNVAPLTDGDILWADYVFLGGMGVQRESAQAVVARCRSLDRKVVAGGWLFTTLPEEFPSIDHLVIGEAEEVLPVFLRDLAAGRARRRYEAAGYPELTRAPAPLWSLIDMRHYVEMSVQYSRGCPFHCDFCQVVVQHGYSPRTKTPQQVLAELEDLHHRGWRGLVMVVDDNLIGSPRRLKEELLPAVIEWQKAKKYPFELQAQVSINLADDDELMRLMADAGFKLLLVGIESPHEESLAECSKRHNQGRDMVAQVHRLQRSGFEVAGGFIVGFDSDPPSIFQRQVDFIQRSGVALATVSLLNAMPGTPLHSRLKEQGRVLGVSTGGYADCTTNIIPKMGIEALMDGYRRVIRDLYAPRSYYARVWRFLTEWRPNPRLRRQVRLAELGVFFRVIWTIGLLAPERRYYWRYLLATIFRYPSKLSGYVALTVNGHSLRRVVDSLTASPIPSHPRARAR